MIPRPGGFPRCPDMRRPAVRDGVAVRLRPRLASPHRIPPSVRPEPSGDPAPRHPPVAARPPGPDPRRGAEANDNDVPAHRERARSVLREVVLLVIFALTLAGTYYLGSLNAAHNVIVVPGPSSVRSIVT
jgi:hypothetical protein